MWEHKATSRRTWHFCILLWLELYLQYHTPRNFLDNVKLLSGHWKLNYTELTDKLIDQPSTSFCLCTQLSVKKQTHIALRLKLEIILPVSLAKWIHGFTSYTSIENIGSECKSIQLFLNVIETVKLCVPITQLPKLNLRAQKTEFWKSLRKLTIVS